MKPYKIFSDSSCDLTQELLDQYQISTIPFYVSFDQVTYQKENVEITKADFYHRLTTESVYPKTSLPSVEDYCDKFEEAIKNGFDVLCLNITLKFSGSHQSAMTAKSIIMEKYPDSQIEVIDSILCTGAQGLLLIEAGKMQQAGYSLSDNAAKLLELRETGRVMLTLGTLEYLKKGGRIGKVSALAGSLLNLKPLIVLEDGELAPYGKVRGFKKAIDKISDMLSEYFSSQNLRYEDFEFCVITGTNMEDASVLRDKLPAVIHKTIEHPIFILGTTIGTYTGPDIVGVCLLRKYNA
ncbi:DegV family protein [Anaerosporobacter faecicola]|uniref:DegV family protein n=1 Tax=Anaerosporobacter faecicola TaxID=2718714 RepID=UPI00143C2EDE|nr:DegV family protein [Anaerosporobacter faecicola]